jgi:SAM-dependent methyltransferase
MVRLTERLRRATGRVGPGSTHGEFTRDLAPGTLGRDSHPVTSLLYERLDGDAVAEVERLAAEAPEIQALGLDIADPGVHEWAVLHFGMSLGVSAIAERTRLPTEQPPDGVHAMARGPLAAAGGLYEADLVVAALDSAGISIDGLRAGLDFGCSSGRVVRVLAATYPNIRWLGCDPNAPAIAWASEHIPRVEFFASGGEPPLALDSGSLDLAFAISIWSHFAPELGLRWFSEMHRIVRPGGFLVFTTHGPTSVAHDASAGRRAPQQLDEILEALYRRGWWYRAEFGEEGDWGMVNAAWGTTFLSPEWLLGELCPAWRVLEFAAGRNQSNQDVYVLERV